jgi:hypothetical protein
MRPCPGSGATSEPAATLFRAGTIQHRVDVSGLRHRFYFRRLLRRKTVGKTIRRIKSASTFEFQAPDRSVALDAFRHAVDEASREHSAIKNHQIVTREQSLTIDFEVEVETWESAERTVLEVIHAAVARIDGRILTEDGSATDTQTSESATFEELGTYLVPA